MVRIAPWALILLTCSASSGLLARAQAPAGPTARRHLGIRAYAAERTGGGDHHVCDRQLSADQSASPSGASGTGAASLRSCVPLLRKRVNTVTFRLLTPPIR